MGFGTRIINHVETQMLSSFLFFFLIKKVIHTISFAPIVIPGYHTGLRPSHNPERKLLQYVPKANEQRAQVIHKIIKCALSKNV